MKSCKSRLGPQGRTRQGLGVPHGSAHCPGAFGGSRNARQGDRDPQAAPPTPGFSFSIRHHCFVWAPDGHYRSLVPCCHGFWFGGEHVGVLRKKSNNKGKSGLTRVYTAVFKEFLRGHYTGDIKQFEPTFGLYVGSRLKDSSPCRWLRTVTIQTQVKEPVQHPSSTI